MIYSLKTNLYALYKTNIRKTYRSYNLKPKNVNFDFKTC